MLVCRIQWHHAGPPQAGLRRVLGAHQRRDAGGGSERRAQAPDKDLGPRASAVQGRCRLMEDEGVLAVTGGLRQRHPQLGSVQHRSVVDRSSLSARSRCRQS